MHSAYKSKIPFYNLSDFRPSLVFSEYCLFKIKFWICCYVLFNLR